MRYVNTLVSGQDLASDWTWGGREKERRCQPEGFNARGCEGGAVSVCGMVFLCVVCVYGVLVLPLSLYISCMFNLSYTFQGQS